jgi:aminoglycoside phosphotransferase (APT) family kinase protein
VRRLVAGQFPRWADLPVERVANGGWDNWTFHLGSEMSVRLPSAFEYTEAVDKEHRWLPVFAPRLPLPISVPLAKGEAGEGYPYSWSIYEWLDGETARVDRIADPVQFALDLAEFIAALQGVGDPSCDLAVAWTLLTSDGRRAFRERLSVDGATWARGRGWALWKTLVDYANALDDGEAATASPRRILDEIFSEYTDGDTAVRARV